MMKVSIVMTTYNGEKYILEQLISLREQTRIIDEVIISDDGSTDKTPDIVRRFINDNNLDNWHFNVNNENKGWIRNFVETASMASGDLIFFCDQDDIWINTKVQVMAETMQDNPNINVLAGRYIKFSNELPDIDIQNKGLAKVKMDSRIMNTELPGCVYCVRSVFWQKIVKYWDGFYPHDSYCWILSKMTNTAYILETPVIYWRKHNDSVYGIESSNMKKNGFRVQSLKNMELRIDCLKNIINNLYFEKKTAKLVFNYERFLKLRIKMLSNHNPFYAFRILKYMNFYSKKKQFLGEIYLSMKYN